MKTNVTNLDCIYYFLNFKSKTYYEKTNRYH
jgi:hypothetical protein